MTDDDDTRLLRGLLAAHTDLDVLPHAGPAGRDMLVADVREILPSMMERCQHVPALLTAKANRTPVGTLYTGVRLTEEATRRLRKAHDYLTRA